MDEQSQLFLSWKKFAVAACVAAAVALVPGCPGAGPGPEPVDNDNTGGGGGDATTLRVSFDAEGGNYAVAEDDAGNEYAFRASDGGDEITETNIKLANGDTLKVSIDESGRPVNFRLSDGTNADVYYSDDDAIVLYTDANGTQTQTNVDTSTGKRIASGKGRVAWQSDPSDDTERLRDGLATYAEYVDALFSDTENPDSPLVGSPLEEGAERTSEVATEYDVVEVDDSELADVTLDETPAAVLSLAARTFKMFDAEGLCPEITGVASTLAFDSFGILQSENDRNVVFPDFGAAENRVSDLFINYSTRAPINPAPDLEDVQITLTPVFTGTSVDNQGRIVIERRFEAITTFSVISPVTGDPLPVTATQLFDAALLGGVFDDDGNVIEFDLVLIDLQGDGEPRRVGTLRYHDQNTSTPASLFTCITDDDGTLLSGIDCPGSTAIMEPFTVSFVPSAAEADKAYQYDWFVSDGLGKIQGSPFGESVQVVATGEGPVETTLILSEVEASTGQSTGVFQVYSCETFAGVVPDDGGVADPEELALFCPVTMTVGEPGFFNVDGFAVSDIVLSDWIIFGTGDAIIEDPFDTGTDVTFFATGKFDVGFKGETANGTEYLTFCTVTVGGSADFDPCADNGFYGDGICDPFCPKPDPDCGGDFFDVCFEEGYYDDGLCDEFCIFPDPDCGGEFDVCLANGLYFDGVCDAFCPFPDPDCAGGQFDICATQGFYGDGFCDPFCPKPDPDCGGGAQPPLFDLCGDEGFYGDGFCDDFCLFPDPDCGGAVDECLINGFYFDGICDQDCLYPDPDCGFVDFCEINGWYGDGICDPFCVQPDPDCDGSQPFDPCDENGFYGDGICDDFCPLPDPDCNGGGGGGDICADLGYYGDGICDEFCQFPDPDCDDDGGSGDFCADLGYYGDGEYCDIDCPLPDPDCDNGLPIYDVCEEFDYYGDGECDDFCIQPDPDCF